jgi:mannose-P-dolichol utilization defect protein 1
MDALRSTLQPITQNLPAPIRDLGVSLLGETCYKSLLYEIDISNTPCIKLAISKGLGIGIIGASSVVKVPQILKLLDSKSSDGVSFLSYLLETSAYLISLAYNFRKGFAFSTYGETALILVQNVVIAVLVLNYSGKKSAAAVFVAGLAGAAATLFGEQFLGMETLSILQVGAGVLGVASKVPQIAAVWQEGGTGQLSAFAVCQVTRTSFLLAHLSTQYKTSHIVSCKLIWDL